MECPSCTKELVKSNLNHDSEEMFLTEYFCFWCGALYECESYSGDFVEENLNSIGEINNWEVI